MGSTFTICNDMGQTINVSCGSNFNYQLSNGQCTSKWKGSLSLIKTCTASSMDFTAWRNCFTGPTANSNHQYYVRRHFWDFRTPNKRGRRMEDSEDEFDMETEDEDKKLPKFMESKGLKGKIINWLVGLADEDTSSTECNADIDEDALECIPKCFRKSEDCPEECDELSEQAPLVKCTIEQFASKHHTEKLDKCLDACKQCEEGEGCQDCEKCGRILMKAAKVLENKAFMAAMKKGGKGRFLKRGKGGKGRFLKSKLGDL